MFAPHLRYFVALAKEGHFSRAAKVCDVTQPTLSMAIRSLEGSLEVPLVERGHRFVGLTPEGRRVLVWAQQTLADYESLKQELAALRSELSGVLRLGVIPAAMPSIAHLTAPFRAAHPKVMFDIRSVDSRTIERGLDAFELDGGITYLDNEPLSHVRCIPLYREKFVFITRAGNPRARRKSITWREAVQENLCLLSEDMQNRRIINDLAKSKGFSLGPTMVSNSFAGICAHVLEGSWSSIVPHTFARIFSNENEIAVLQLTEPVHSQTIGLVVSDREPVSLMTEALMACAKALNPDEKPSS